MEKLIDWLFAGYFPGDQMTLELTHSCSLPLSLSVAFVDKTIETNCQRIYRILTWLISLHMTKKKKENVDTHTQDTLLLSSLSLAFSFPSFLPSVVKTTVGQFHHLLDFFYILESIIQIIEHWITQDHRMSNNSGRPSTNERERERERLLLWLRNLRILTVISLSVNSCVPVFLLMICATPMTTLSRFKIGIQHIEWVR